MKLFFDDYHEKPEILLTDSHQGLRKLGELMLNLDKEIELSGEQVCDPYNLKGLVLKINSDRLGDNLIHISLAKNYLVIEGTSIALGKLGSVLSDFDENTPDRYHIHLDYFPDIPGLLAPTNCSLIIMCIR